MVNVRLVLLIFIEIINSCHYYFIELIFISLKVIKSATNDKILQETSDIFTDVIIAMNHQLFSLKNTELKRKKRQLKKVIRPWKNLTKTDQNLV